MTARDISSDLVLDLTRKTHELDVSSATTKYELREIRKDLDTIADLLQGEKDRVDRLKASAAECGTRLDELADWRQSVEDRFSRWAEDVAEIQQERALENPPRDPWWVEGGHWALERWKWLVPLASTVSLGGLEVFFGKVSQFFGWLSGTLG